MPSRSVIWTRRCVKASCLRNIIVPERDGRPDVIAKTAIPWHDAVMKCDMSAFRSCSSAELVHDKQLGLPKGNGSPVGGLGGTGSLALHPLHPTPPIHPCTHPLPGPNRLSRSSWQIEFHFSCALPQFGGNTVLFMHRRLK